jgi:hypothetical protein
MYICMSVGPTQSFLEWVPWFFPRIKQPGNGVDYSHVYSARLRVSGAVPVFHPYASMAWTETALYPYLVHVLALRVGDASFTFVTGECSEK